MKLDNGKYDAFTIMIRGGESVLDLGDVLRSVYGDKVIVSIDSSISTINYNYVMERLQHKELLSQMTKEQRDRAYEMVKRYYYTPDYVDDMIDEIIDTNWTDIVFGNE